jgi:hypothetical protein
VLTVRRCYQIVIAALVLFPATSSASTVLFTFSGTADASGFGLSSSEPFSITWSYDPTQPPFSTVGTPTFRAAYENIEATVQVGLYTVTTTSLIGVDHDNPGLGNDDSFLMSADTFLADTTIEGTINGITVGGYNLTILDENDPATMFSSTGLPTGASFVGSATLIEFSVSAQGSAAQIDQQLSPGSFTFTASAVPEPGTLGSCGIVLLFAYRRLRSR